LEIFLGLITHQARFDYYFYHRIPSNITMTMKIVLFFLLLATPALASFESSIHRDVRQVLQVYVSRHLELSVECMNDTDALFANNTDLAAADAVLYAEEDMNSTATAEGCTETDSSVICIFDYSTMEGHAEYLAACDAAGGELYVMGGYSIKCSGEFFGAEFVSETTMTNMPTCIATSCDAELVEAEAKAAFEDIEQMVAGLEEMGMTCTSEMIPGSGSGGGDGSGSGSGGGDSAAPSMIGSFMSLASVTILAVSWFSM
jgi:hypothetical protein